MSSFTTSLKDTLSDLASKASSNTTNTSTNPQDSSSNPQTSTTTTTTTTTTSDNNKNNGQDSVRGLVGLIPMSRSLFDRYGAGGSGSGEGGLLPVDLKGDGPGTPSDEKKGASLGVGDEGGEGITPFQDTVKNPMEDQEKKNGCGCPTGADTGTGTGAGVGKEECCANTGDCGNCKGCKESKDSGKYCQCRCKNQRLNTSGDKECGCQGDDGSRQDQDRDNSVTRREEYGGKSSSFKDLGTTTGAGVGFGAGSGEDYGSNDPSGQTDNTTTTSNVSHQFSGGGSDDFNPSPSAITAATDELIAGAKNESETGGGRGTGGNTGSGGLGGELGRQD